MVDTCGQANLTPHTRAHFSQTDDDVCFDCTCLMVREGVFVA